MKLIFVVSYTTLPKVVLGSFVKYTKAKGEKSMQDFLMQGLTMGSIVLRFLFAIYYFLTLLNKTNFPLSLVHTLFKGITFQKTVPYFKRLDVPKHEEEKEHQVRWGSLASCLSKDLQNGSKLAGTDDTQELSHLRRQKCFLDPEGKGLPEQGPKH